MSEVDRDRLIVDIYVEHRPPTWKDVYEEAKAMGAMFAGLPGEFCDIGMIDDTAQQPQMLLDTSSSPCIENVNDHLIVPPIWQEALTKSLTSSLKTPMLFGRSKQQRQKRVEYRRKIRRARAAFRRRKRGLI